MIITKTQTQGREHGAWGMAFGMNAVWLKVFKLCSLLHAPCGFRFLSSRVGHRADPNQANLGKNSKLEIRNSKQYQMTKIQNFKAARLAKKSD